MSKRIKVFVSNWPKLNDKVKIRMNNLIKGLNFKISNFYQLIKKYFLIIALDKSELKEADDIHVSLMLDFPSEVSLWMVGIKKLIHELIGLNKSKIEIENGDNTSACQISNSSE